MADAPEAWLQLERALRAEVAQVKSAAGTEVQIQAATLGEFDSSALSLLLGAARVCRELGVRLRLHDAPPKLTALARVYGVAELLFEPA